MAYGHESGSHSPASTPRSEVSTGSATPDTVVQPMPKGLASRELSGAPREKKSPFVVRTATPQTAINANATQAAPPVRKTPDAKKALPDFLDAPLCNRGADSSATTRAAGRKAPRIVRGTRSLRRLRRHNTRQAVVAPAFGTSEVSKVWSHFGSFLEVTFSCFRVLSYFGTPHGI